MDHERTAAALRRTSAQLAGQGDAGLHPPAAVDDVTLPDRVALLENEISHLREAVVARQLIGTATGLLAERMGCTTDEAWRYLTRLSQSRNLRVRTIAELVIAGHEDRLSPDDELVLDRLDPRLRRRAGASDRT